jgi:hypothetical protein
MALELKTIREYFADPIGGGVRERINPPEPEQEQLDLFEAAQGERR